MPRHIGLLILSVAVWSCGEWPPVVSNGPDAEALPADKTEIRCIGCDDGQPAGHQPLSW